MIEDIKVQIGNILSAGWIALEAERKAESLAIAREVEKRRLLDLVASYKIKLPFIIDYDSFAFIVEKDGEIKRIKIVGDEYEVIE